MENLQLQDEQQQARFLEIEAEYERRQQEIEAHVNAKENADEIFRKCLQQLREGTYSHTEREQLATEIETTIMPLVSRLINTEKEFEQYKKETVKWSIEDFQDNWEMTDEQAQNALEDMIRHHDAGNGISWDTVNYYAEEHGGTRKDDDDEEEDEEDAQAQGEAAYDAWVADNQ